MSRLTWKTCRSTLLFFAALMYVALACTPAHALHDTDERIAELQAILEKDPDNTEAWIRLGNIQMDISRYPEAIEAYIIALELDPSNAAVQTDLGTCYRRIGKSDKAIEHYRKALSLDPEFAIVNLNIGIVLAYDYENYAEAIPFLERYLRLAPDASNAEEITREIEKFKSLRASDEEAVPQPPSEITTKEKFKEVMVTLINSESFLAASNPFSPMSKAYQPFNQFMKELMTDEVVLDALFEIVTENQYTVTDFEKFGRAWGEEVSTRGLQRLSDDDIETLLGLTLNIMERGSVVECRHLLTESPDGFNYRVLEYLDTPEIKAYFNITRKAVLAELNQDPKQLLTRDQSDIAYEVLSKQFHDEDAYYMGAILQDIEKYSPVEACWAGSKLIRGILDMKGLPKKWMLREYMSNF